MNPTMEMSKQGSHTDVDLMLNILHRRLCFVEEVCGKRTRAGTQRFLETLFIDSEEVTTTKVLTVLRERALNRRKTTK